MSAEKTLFKAYQEWRRLAEAEGEAIRRRNWNFLLDCQAVIKKFQPLITKLTREATAEWNQSGADLVAKKNQIATIVAELIALARKNQSQLAAARALAITEREQLTQARRNLKQLQQSYVIARPTAWSSFS